MGQPLRVLLVEDSGDDAALILRALRRGGYETACERVETPEAFVEALARGGWDLVLSDYSLPRLDALEVLDLLQEHAPRLPCIVLSGNIGEETAVATMRAGAADYLMKSNLARLLPTVERELRGAGERRERVETKRALLDLQEQFGVIFREFADVMLIARAGGETAAGGARSEVLHANPALDRVLGFSSRDLVGRSLESLWPESRRRNLHDLLARVRREGSVFVSAESFRRLDGSSCPMDVLASLVPWGGREQAVVLTLRDVTERRRAERRLAGEKEQLAVTLRSIGEGVITTDTLGRVLLMNRVAEEITGLSQVEAHGRPLAEVFPVVHAETGESLADRVEEVQRLGVPGDWTRDVRLHTPDGRDLALSLTASPIRPEGAERRDGPGSGRGAGHGYVTPRFGHPTAVSGSSTSAAAGAVLVFRDITRERMLEEEMTKASKLESLGILAGGIAHDFNNLLMAILGNLSLAKFNARHGANGATPGPENIVGILEKAEQACHYASDLTRQLLTFAKGGAPIKRTLVLNDLVRDAVTFALHGTRLVCHFELDPDLQPVEVDRHQFRQVLDNIVINAVQATPEGGRLRITTRNVEVTDEAPVADLPPGPHVTVTIRDSGVGIQPEALPKIFDPFFTTKEGGSGLGLATCYSIIKKHGGTILVDSTPGDGACFSVFLPASAEGAGQPATSVPMRHPDPPRRQDRRQGRVLFMDDEEILRELVGDMLQHLGYEVVGAKDGQSAVERFVEARAAGRPFDVVIVDLTVPGAMGGFETVQVMRGMDPDVRAVVSSGYSNDPVMANHRAHGFRGMIAKPYQMTDLDRVLREATQDLLAAAP